jgi:CHASE3 domain sensor protein
MDKLEEHIRKNREAFDKYNPPASIWRRIKHELGIGKPMPGKWLSLAAMIVIVLGTAIVLFKPQNRWANKVTDRTARTYPQLKETEIYYNNLVNSLYKEAVPLLTNNPDVKKELNTDLSQIDSICSDIKKDLKDNISNQEVVEALIQNYRTKISILQDMLSVLKENENNPEKKKSHEL